MSKGRVGRVVGMLILIVVLLGNTALGQETEQMTVVDFGFREVIEPNLKMEECVVRARYLLRLPEEIENEFIAETYEGFEEIHLIEYGYFNISPVMQSCFICVGIMEDGTMERLPTPFDMVKKMYDFSAFDGMIVEYVEETEGD